LKQKDRRDKRRIEREEGRLRKKKEIEQKEQVFFKKDTT